MHYLHLQKKIFLGSISFILLFSSCIKDSINDLANIKGVEVDPYESVPLINTHMGIKDIYNSYSSSAFIVEGSDKFVTFIYQSNEILPQKQFVAVPSLQIGYNLSMDQGSINQFNTIGNYTNSFSNYAVVKPNNKERIKKISVKDGSFVIHVSSDFKHNVVIVFVYPSITLNGKQLVDTIVFNYSGISPITIDKVIDLSGYDIDLSDRGISYNVIPYLFEINLNRIIGNPVLLSDKLIINEQVNISTYNYLQGYLGKFSVLKYSTDESIDIFNKQADGNIFIKDPKVRVMIEDGIGMPITAKISNMNVLTGKGVNYPVIVDHFKDTFTFDYPLSNQIGQIIKSGFVIDKTNSNIDSVFSHAPQKVMYDIEFTANYNELQDEDNFLFDKNTFNANSSIEIPLELKVYSYGLRSSDTLIWPKVPDGLTIDWVKITGWYQNSFPIGNTVQIYFAKDSTIMGIDSFVVVDSLYAQPVFVPGAIIDVNGKLLQSSTVTNDAVMDDAKYNRLKNVVNKYLLISDARTSDFNGVFPFVKIYSDQGMDFKIGVEVKGKYRKKF